MPETIRTWVGTFPGIRTHLQLWQVSAPVPNHDTAAAIAQTLIGEGAGKGFFEQCELTSVCLDNVYGIPFTHNLLSGEFLVLLLDAGTEILVHTATHTGRCFLPNRKWVLVGSRKEDDRKHAALGLTGEISVHVNGPWPHTAWVLPHVTPCAPRPSPAPPAGSDTSTGNPRAEPVSADPGPQAEGQPEAPMSWNPPPNLHAWLNTALAHEPDA